MKILLLTCLVASVFAAPAEKTKRNVLFGDSRYDSHHHDHDDVHAHHENERDISRALGSSTGSLFTPSSDYGIPGFTPGTPLGSNSFKSLKQDYNSGVNTRSESVTKSSFPSLKDHSISSTASAASDSSDSVILNAGKGFGSSSEKTFKSGVVTGDAVSADFASTTVNPVTIGDRINSESVSIDANSGIESSTRSFQPEFDSSFGSTFGSSFGSPFNSGFGHSLDTSFYSPSSIETIPLGATGFSTFDQTNSQPSFLPTYNLNNNADKKLFKPAEDLKVQTKSGGSGDTSKTTFESSTVKADFGSPFLPEIDSSFIHPFGGPFESEIHLPESGALPFDNGKFTKYLEPKYTPTTFSNIGLASGAGKELAKSVDDSKVRATTESSKLFSDSANTFIGSTTARPETFGKEFSSGVESVTGKSETRSSFGSDYNSGFPSSFGQSFGQSFGSDLSSTSFGANPFQTTSFNNFDQFKYNPTPYPGYNFNTNAGKEATIKSVELSKVTTRIGDAGKAGNTVKIEKSTKLGSTHSVGPTFNSGVNFPKGHNLYSTSVEVIPSISTGYRTFDQVKYNPSYSSNYPYTPSFNGYNGNYGQYGANYGSLNGYRGINTFGVNTYPGLNSYVPSQPLRYQTGYSSSQFVTPSPFSSAVTVSESSPFGLDIGNQRSYLSPSIERFQQFSASTAAPPHHQGVFKSYQSPTSFAQSTPAPFYQLNQPQVKISGSSLSGVSQQTDANGGYIY